MRSGDCGVITWGWWVNSGHAEQENRSAKLDTQIATLRGDSDRILAKLDEILRELRARK